MAYLLVAGFCLITKVKEGEKSLSLEKLQNGLANLEIGLWSVAIQLQVSMEIIFAAMILGFQN